jgi:hypothetical protein
LNGLDAIVQEFDLPEFFNLFGHDANGFAGSRLNPFGNVPAIVAEYLLVEYQVNVAKGVEDGVDVLAV